MERLREFLEQECKLGEEVLVDEVCQDLLLRKPNLNEFHHVLASLLVGRGQVSEYKARVIGFQAYKIFMEEEGDFRRDFLRASDSVAAALWPLGKWKRAMDQTGIKCEKKFLNLLAEMREIHMRREDVNYVFVKGTSYLVTPKTPDYFLVDKNYQDPPTAETVGGLLFTQSNTEATNSYCAATAVGEAIACGQVLLRNASQQRNFVLVGVTNLKAIRWFKVERPSVAGGFNGCQDAETSKTTHNLAGYMLCSVGMLGLCVRSISTKMGSIRLGTTHFASDKVLGYLEEGCEEFAFDSSDDLVSQILAGRVPVFRSVV